MAVARELQHSTDGGHPNYCLYFTLAEQLLPLCVATQ